MLAKLSPGAGQSGEQVTEGCSLCCSDIFLLGVKSMGCMTSPEAKTPHLLLPHLS